jgi:hypothetical protein
MPHCHWSFEAKHAGWLAFLHDTALLDRQLHYTASIYENGQKGIEEAV